MRVIVSESQPIPIRAEKGSTIVVRNDSGVTVYYARTPQPLMNVQVGGIPDNGVPLMSPDEIVFSNFPGVMWFRSTVEVNITVYGR